MRIELLYFEDCPSWTTADRRLRQIADPHGLHVEHRLVTSSEEAERARFRGSPTILIDGRDPFAHGAGGYGLSCRRYETPDGPAGSPTVAQLEVAIGLHADR